MAEMLKISNSITRVNLFKTYLELLNKIYQYVKRARVLTTIKMRARLTTRKENLIGFGVEEMKEGHWNRTQ